MPASFVQNLDDRFKAHADPDKATQMARYMRDQFPFYGIASPLRNELVRQTIAETGLPAMDDLPLLITALWGAEQREHQYAAIDIIKRQKKKLPESAIYLAEFLIITKSWWDTVDMLSQHMVGQLMQSYPDLLPPWISQWRTSDNLWLRRTTLIFQLKYKQATDFNLLCSLIEENRDSDEFFIQKAIGWALREYSKTAPDRVSRYIDQTELAPLSHREGLKWLKRR